MEEKNSEFNLDALLASPKSIVKEEFKDYSGPFNSDLKLENFSKETLLKYADAAVKTFLLLLHNWQEEVKERYGVEEEIATEEAIWPKQSPTETRWTMEALNIKGNDLVAWMKVIRWSPGGFYPRLYPDWKVEFESDKKCTLIVGNCPVNTILEDTDQPRLISYCQGMEPRAFQRAATQFNPKIKVKATKLPPRESKDQPACIWEFTLED